LFGRDRASFSCIPPHCPGVLVSVTWAQQRSALPLSGVKRDSACGKCCRSAVCFAFSFALPAISRAIGGRLYAHCLPATRGVQAAVGYVHPHISTCCSYRLWASVRRGPARSPSLTPLFPVRCRRKRWAKPRRETSVVDRRWRQLVCSAPSDQGKVEPPNRWVGHSLNPVRLLIHGFAGLRFNAP
jgi:hypothetical protein